MSDFLLQFGTLDWSSSADNGPVEVKAYGLRRGNPAPVTSVVESLLRDGGLERIDSHGNRDQTVLLCLNGTPAALEAYEATLFRECQKDRNELRWRTSGSTVTGVFDVLWAIPEFAEEDEWDFRDVAWGQRNYTVTFRALPFARSVLPFSLTGTTSAATPTTVTIDDGSSATGWTGSQGSAVTSVSGQLKMPIAFVPRNDIAQGTWVSGSERATRTSATVSMTDTQYLTVEWKAESSPGAYAFTLLGYADGALLTRVSTVPGSTPGLARTTFLCPDTSVTVFAFAAQGQVDGSTAMPTGTLTLDNLQRTNQAPSVGTSRQKVSLLNVPGSARTPASLSVSHPSSALGNAALVYSSRSLGAYSPPLSIYAVTAGTADTTTVSGRRFTSASQAFDIPASLLPSGTYQLVARAARPGNTSTAVSFTPSATTRLNGADVTPIQSRPSVAANFPDLGVYQNVVLGTFVLPPADVPLNSAAAVRINVGNPSGINVDEAWLFHMPDDGTASLSIVPCGTAAPTSGGTSNRLWLDAATPTRPFPSAYVGTLADRSDARAADGSTAIWDEHLFDAGENLVFTVTPNALDATVTLDGWARWLTNPAA